MSEYNASGKARSEIRRHNRSAVLRYITDVREARHQGRKGSGGGGAKVKHRESMIPVSDMSISSMDDEDNRFAARLLNPIIEHFMRYEHADSYFLIEEASLQHTHWEDGKTPQDRHLHKLFNRAVTRTENELNRRHPGVEITVNVSPRRKRVKNKREAAGVDRTAEAQDNYQVIVKRLEQIEAENPHLTRERCVEILSNRMKAEKQKGSPGRIRKAIEVVNRIGREESAAV